MESGGSAWPVTNHASRGYNEASKWINGECLLLLNQESRYKRWEIDLGRM